MKFIIAAAALAGSVTAIPQTTTLCPALPVLEACLGSTLAGKQACGLQDFNCLCDAMKVIVQCYDQCPGDAGVVGSQAERDSYCAYVTTTTAPVSAPTTTTSGSTPTGDADTTATTDEASSSTDDADAATDGDDTSSGSDLAINAGGMLAAVAGVVVAAL